MTTTRQQILEAVRARLQAIRTIDGFATDAGEQVFLGEAPMLGPDDPDVAIAIVIGDDVPTFQGEQVLLQLPLGLCALAKADLAEPWIAVETLLGDIKTAFELPDRTLGGLLRGQVERRPTLTLEREPGSTTVGVCVGYMARYTEVWGNP